MTLLALDPTRLLLMTVAGLVFAGAGLWLLLRTRPAGGAAKIELFGMKFEASSAGLLVFLIGAAFVAAPTVVPERSVPQQNPTLVAGKLAATPAVGNTAIILPAGPAATEQEPNNGAHEANQIARGTFYAGVTDPERKDVEDWYAIPASGLVQTDAGVQIRVRTGTKNPFFCEVYLLDARESLLEKGRFPAIGTSLHLTAFVEPTAFLLVRVASTNEWPCVYELQVP